MRTLTQLFLCFFSLLNTTLIAQCWSVHDPHHESLPWYDARLGGSVFRVSIADDSTVWIIGSKSSPNIVNLSLDQYLSKSEDGGRTWGKKNLPFSQKGVEPLFIHFINRDSGYYYFDEKPLYYTTDGGKTWNQGLNPNTMIPTYSTRGGHFYDQYTKRIWIVCGDNGGNGDKGFYISNDFGKTWQFKPINVEKDDGFDLHIREDGRGWLTDDYSFVSKANLYLKEKSSSNFTAYNPGFSDNTYRLSFHGDYGAIIPTRFNKIAMTKDYGETWYEAVSDSSLSLPNIDNQRRFQFLRVKVIDSLETIAAGHVDTFFSINVLYRPILVKTYDAGKTWRHQKLEGPQDKPLTDVEIYGRDFAVATADGSRVYVYRRPAPPQCDAVRITDTLKVGQPLKWGAASGCIGGYVLKIGITPDGGELIDSLDLWDQTQWTPNITLPYGKPIYVSIRPYNDGGFAPSCPSVLLPTQSCTLETKIDTLLKAGTSYKGIVYQQDTILLEKYKSKQGCDSVVKVVIDVLTSNQEILAATQPSLKIHPNPSSDMIQVEVKNIAELTDQNTFLVLSDMTGKELQRFSIQQLPFTSLIQLGQYPGGVYLIQVQSRENVLLSERVVVIR